MSGSGLVCEWRVIFFKHTAAQATYRVSIITSLDKDHRQELDAILDSIEMVE